MRYACVHAPFEKTYRISPSLTAKWERATSKTWQQKSAPRSRPEPPRCSKLCKLWTWPRACSVQDHWMQHQSETLQIASRKKRKRCVFAGTIRRLRGAQAGSWQAITPPTVATSGIVRTVWKLTCWWWDTWKLFWLESLDGFLLDFSVGQSSQAAKDAAVLSSLQQLVLSLELFVRECPWRCVCLSRDGSC